MRLTIMMIGLFALALTSCSGSPPAVPSAESRQVSTSNGCRLEADPGSSSNQVHRGRFDLQGHRGARGLAPENTMTGFSTALAIGVTTLELDVVLTRDGVPVVTHDSRPNPDIARIGGVYVDRNRPPFRSLPLEEVQRYDVGRLRPGSRYARMFPDQRPDDGATIPTLRAVFALTRDSAANFNIETKVDTDDEGAATEPDAFIRAIVDTARREGVLERITIQSFDWRTLEAAARIAPDVERSCLTAVRWWDKSEPGGSEWFAKHSDGRDVSSLPRLVKDVGCGVWSPYSGNVTAENVSEAKSEGLRVIPWTVNTRAEAHRMLVAGVDGFITDYPDRMRILVSELCSWDTVLPSFK